MIVNKNIFQKDNFQIKLIQFRVTSYIVQEFLSGNRIGSKNPA